MTVDFRSQLSTATLAIAGLGLLLWQADAHAQNQRSRTVAVDAVIGSHVKVTFDRSSVVLDTGAGFRPGTANPNTAKMLGSWRGSGVWTGSQTYAFEDSWSYPVGVYGLTMTYTLSAP